METHSVLLALVRVIRRWPVDSPHKGPVTRSFDVFFVVSLAKLLIKQSDDLGPHNAHATSMQCLSIDSSGTLNSQGYMFLLLAILHDKSSLTTSSDGLSSLASDIPLSRYLLLLADFCHLYRWGDDYSSHMQNCDFHAFFLNALVFHALIS